MDDRVFCNGDEPDGLDAEQTTKELDGLILTFESLSPEERAYRLMRIWFDKAGNCEKNDTGGFSDELEAKFIKWLLCPANSEAKEKALERIFSDCFKESELMFMAPKPTTRIPEW